MSRSLLKMLGFNFYLPLPHLRRPHELILEINQWSQLLYKLDKKDKGYDFFQDC